MNRTRRGLTLMEVVIGTLLVGMVLAGTIELVGPTVRSSALAADAVVARLIADDLCDEIMVQPYEDAAQTGAIGPEAGETGANRSRFDDVDDYNGWSAAPQSADGVAVAGLTGSWVVQCGVQWVGLSDPNTAKATDTGVKRVTVRVRRGGVLLAEREFLRTRGFDLARKD